MIRFHSRWMKGRKWKEPHIATQLTEFLRLHFTGRVHKSVFWWPAEFVNMVNSIEEA